MIFDLQFVPTVIPSHTFGQSYSLNLEEMSPQKRPWQPPSFHHLGSDIKHADTHVGIAIPVSQSIEETEAPYFCCRYLSIPSLRTPSTH